MRGSGTNDVLMTVITIIGAVVGLVFVLAAMWYIIKTAVLAALREHSQSAPLAPRVTDPTE